MDFARRIIFLSLLVPILSFSQDKELERAWKVYNKKNKALNAYNKGDYREALKYIDENLKKDPSSLENILLKSDVLYELKEFEKVVDLLQNIDDLDAEYRVMLSNSLYETEHFEEAKEVFRSLLNDEKKDVMYCNLGAAFFNMEIADSAIYYAQRAVEMRPTEGLYHFNLGTAYVINDEADKACGQFFLASKLSFDEAWEWYETENCESWKHQWLSQLSGSDRMTIENTIFPLIKDKAIVAHRSYLFEESGKIQQVMLVGMTELVVGTVFKFIDDDGRTLIRWSDDGKKDWTLRGVKRFDETSFR